MNAIFQNVGPTYVWKCLDDFILECHHLPEKKEQFISVHHITYKLCFLFN